MNKLKLVSFEQAKKLKELGFPQGNTLAFYSRTGNLWNIESCFDNISYDLFDELEKIFKIGRKDDAPSLELVSKWFRTEKDIYINVEKGPNVNEYWYKYEIPDTVNNRHKVVYNNVVIYDDYEKALSAGIDEIIKIILNNG